MGARHKPQHGEDGNHGGTAVADQRQGQTDNRHGADAHTDVDHVLEHQGGSRTETHQPPHIVRGLDTHVNAPGNDGKLQQHHNHTAQEPQFLADGGENIVRVLSEEVAALGTVAVEQALARQAAAGQRLEVDFVVVAFVDTLGVNGVVKEDQNSVLLVFTKEWPKYRKGNADARNGQRKPPQAHAAGEGHTDEDEHENQRHACVPGHGHVEANQKSQVEHHVHDRGNGGDVILVGGHNRGHDDDIGQLTDLSGLNVDEREFQPASVAGVVVGAKRGDEQKQQQGVENHHGVSVLGHDIQVQ